MTLNLRKSLLGCLLLPSIAGSVFCGIVWYWWFNNMFSNFPVPPGLISPWWLIQRQAISTDLPWALAGISFLCFFPLAGELFLRSYFGRSNSPEMFFMRFSILSLPFQASRFLVLFAGADLLPYWWSGVGMRIAWFGKFLGLIALLGIAIFSGNISFRRSGFFLALGTLAAMSIAIMMPIDSSQPLGNLMVRTGSANPLALICIFAQILSVSGLIGNAYSRHIPRYYSLALYMLLIVLGADMAFFTSRPFITISSLLLAFGLAGFSRENRKIHQWI